ncbi:MAG: purine-nucleoside phosphorylase [Treponemataceae bacterium]
MSTHIGAKEGQIAQSILLPGDPLRAKYVAENFLTDVICYNEIRGMMGFTGNYKGKAVSVQGTGMGQPSLSIYVNELFEFYNVQNAIRVGTCGAIHNDIKVRDVILAMSACTDSGINTHRFNGMHFAPTASFDLLHRAVHVARDKEIAVRVGSVTSSDLFYDDNNFWKLWASYGVLGVEMEAAELFTLAAKYNRKALAILTVSDHIITGESTSAQERQNSLNTMLELALETAISC